MLSLKKILKFKFVIIFLIKTKLNEDVAILFATY